jgi:riboflavin kinase/FMN adenylyltransferase
VKKLLVDKLNAKHIIIGYDHQFGKNRSAGIDDLKIFGKQFGFEVEEISVQDVDDVAVSSTKIRNALNTGDITTANSYLGYPYFITGTVIKGKGLGRQIDFPTANISIEETYKLIPKHGVYVVKTTVQNQTVFGMMNIGTNPTVNGKEQSIEVHLFDFNADIYGVKLKVELLHRLRVEHHFESVDDLKNQLFKDKIKALDYLRT